MIIYFIQKRGTRCGVSEKQEKTKPQPKPQKKKKKKNMKRV
jgi:hypothetical protein